MRGLLATLVACFFAVTIAADCVVCPDRCMDEAPPSAASHVTPSSCALCVGWSQTVVIVPGRPVARVVPHDSVVPTRLTEPDQRRFERPPRLA